MPGRSAIRCRNNSLCLERTFAFLGVAPPGQRRFTRHEAVDSDKVSMDSVHILEGAGTGVID